MTLAIDGGSPVRTEPFPRWPDFGEAEREGLLRALAQGQWWRVSGKEVDAFEAEFAAFHGCDHALAVTNGTHALEVALGAIGVQPGDEVIVPAFTFISTSMAVQRVGAIPIPVDVDLDTYNLDLDAAAAAMGPRTRAVIPVHMAGQVIDMDALAALCGPRGVEIVQDAAHAHGALFDGRRIGEFGSIACFSFQNFKLMSAGEGGAVLLPTAGLRERAFLHHNCGRSPVDRVYAHDVLGSNYRLNEFSAAVLRAQLARLPSQNALRERRAARLREQLAQVPGVIPQARDPRSGVHPHYMWMFRLDPACGVDRNAAVQALVAEGIPAFMNYRVVYRTEAFWQPPAPEGSVAHFAERCPRSERVGSEGVWIHHRVLLGNEQDVDDVARAVERVVSHLAGRTSP